LRETPIALKETYPRLCVSARKILFFSFPLGEIIRATIREIRVIRDKKRKAVIEITAG
jgi:hypothetical protein